MKKIIYLFCLGILTSMLFCSCKNEVVPNDSSNIVYAPVIGASTEPLSEKEIKNTAISVIAKAEYTYNSLIKGCLDTDDDSKPIVDQNGYEFAKVEGRYKNVSDLKKDAEKYFSIYYLNNDIYPSVFDGVTPYYIDNDEVLYKNISIFPDTENYISWKIDDYKLILNDGKTVVAEVPFEDVEGNSGFAYITVSECEDGVWRICFIDG